MEYKKVFHKILRPWLMNLQFLVKRTIIKRMTGVIVDDMISKPYLKSLILHVRYKNTRPYVHFPQCHPFLSILFMFVNLILSNNQSFKLSMVFNTYISIRFSYDGVFLVLLWFVKLNCKKKISLFACFLSK